MKDEIFDRYKKIKNYSEFTPFTPRALVFKAVGSNNIIDFKKSKYWYIYVDANKTITFQNAALGEIYILKMKIESEKILTLPDNLRWPATAIFTNAEGINYIEFLYTTEDYEHYYYDVIALLQGLKPPST